MNAPSADAPAAAPLAARRWPAELAWMWGVSLVCYALSWTLSRNVVEQLPPAWAASGRLLATACMLGVLAWLQPRHRIGMAQLRGSWQSFALLALLGFGGYFGLTFSALQFLHATDLSVVLALTPAMTYLLAVLGGSERVRWRCSAGVALATFSALAFHGLGAGRAAGMHGVGVALAMAAVAAYAGYAVLYGRKLGAWPVVGTVAVLTLLASAQLAVFALLIEGPPPVLSGGAMLKLAILGALLSAPVYVLFSRMVQSGHTLLATLVAVAGPFGVLALEWMLGTRAGSPSDLLLMSAAGIGVWLVVWGRATPFPPRKEAA